MWGDGHGVPSRICWALGTPSLKKQVFALSHRADALLLSHLCTKRQGVWNLSPFEMVWATRTLSHQGLVARWCIQITQIAEWEHTWRRVPTDLTHHRWWPAPVTCSIPPRSWRQRSHPAYLLVWFASEAITQRLKSSSWYVVFDCVVERLGGERRVAEKARWVILTYLRFWPCVVLWGAGQSFHTFQGRRGKRRVYRSLAPCLAWVWRVFLLLSALVRFESNHAKGDHGAASRTLGRYCFTKTVLSRS